MILRGDSVQRRLDYQNSVIGRLQFLGWRRDAAKLLFYRIAACIYNTFPVLLQTLAFYFALSAGILFGLMALAPVLE